MYSVYKTHRELVIYKRWAHRRSTKITHSKYTHCQISSMQSRGDNDERSLEQLFSLSMLHVQSRPPRARSRSHHSKHANTLDIHRPPKPVPRQSTATTIPPANAGSCQHDSKYCKVVLPCERAMRDSLLKFVATANIPIPVAGACFAALHGARTGGGEGIWTASLPSTRWNLRTRCEERVRRSQTRQKKPNRAEME